FVTIPFLILSFATMSLAQKIVTAGQVNGTWRENSSSAKGVTTEFWIWALGHQKLKVEFLGNNAAKGFSNTAVGTATIDGIEAIFKPDDQTSESDPCIMILQFTAGKLIVTQKGECGWGAGIGADGTYRKITSLKPKFTQ